MNRRRSLIGAAIGRLPNEYQEVEFLLKANDRSEPYINTGVSQADDVGILVDALIPTVSTSYDQNWIGARVRSGNRFILSYTNGKLGYGWNDFHTTDISFAQIRKQISFNYLNSRKLVCENVEIDLLGTLQDIPYNIYLFSQSLSGMASCLLSCQIYRAQITKSDNIVRDFIPCVRTFDSKPGMYDLCGSICPLTGTPFYINAGSGEFTAGPAV